VSIRYLYICGKPDTVANPNRGCKLQEGLVTGLGVTPVVTTGIAVVAPFVLRPLTTLLTTEGRSRLLQPADSSVDGGRAVPPRPVVSRVIPRTSQPSWARTYEGWGRRIEDIRSAGGPSFGLSKSPSPTRQPWIASCWASLRSRYENACSATSAVWGADTGCRTGGRRPHERRRSTRSYPLAGRIDMWVPRSPRCRSVGYCCSPEWEW